MHPSVKAGRQWKKCCGYSLPFLLRNGFWAIHSGFSQMAGDAAKLPELQYTVNFLPVIFV